MTKQQARLQARFEADQTNTRRRAFLMSKPSLVEAERKELEDLLFVADIQLNGMARAYAM